MTAVDSEPVTTPPSTAPESARSVRAAFWVFVALCGVMFAVYAYLGRHIWFAVGAAGDEWDFLATRGVTWHDLITQHGGHLVALPLIVYRGIFNVVGLRSYQPYQFLAIGLHIAAGGLLRALMRRRAIDPWIATAAAGLFVCFGSAGQDILWAFQIAFTGALVFGLAQLLCVDHDGRGIDRRDWYGLALGLAAVLCSGVGIAMVGVAGLAIAIRRGILPAVFQVGPLAVLYLAWAHWYGDSIITKDKGAIVRWVSRGVWSVFGNLAQIPVLGFVFAAALVVGLVLGWRRSPRGLRRQWASLPAAMLLGAVGFLTLTGVTRAWAGVRFASSSRYMHIVAALVLVPLAMALNELVRHRKALFGVALVALVAGVPGNLAKTTDTFQPDSFFKQYKQMMLSVARLPIARDVPQDLRPDPNQAPQVTMKWLLSGIAAGWIPHPGPLTPMDEATDTLRLSLQEFDGAPRAPGQACPVLSHPVTRRLARGKSLVLHGRFFVTLLPPTTSVPSTFVSFGSPIFGHGDPTVTAILQPLTIRLAPRTPGAYICG